MEEHRHFILHKPYAVLSQFIRIQKRKKTLLGDIYPFPEGVMAIGRLDEKSEGLLLLTTDGKVSAAVRSKKVEKEYYVEVDGLIDEEAIQKLESGVEIGFDGKKYMTKKSKAYILTEPPNFPRTIQKIRSDRHGPTSWASITISEGKFRQVRKMTAAVGFPTLRLIRVRIGNIHLGELKPGEVIETKELLV